MKNNRLNAEEVGQLRRTVERINELVSMERCKFKNDETVNIHDLKSWLNWFKVEADKIERIIEDK